MATTLQKVKAITDNDGHWYVVPADMEDAFYSMLEYGENEDWSLFNETFSKYRTGGDLNQVQLYAEI